LAEFLKGGESNIYHATELACPFEGPEKQGTPTQENTMEPIGKIYLTETTTGAG